MQEEFNLTFSRDGIARKKRDKIVHYVIRITQGRIMVDAGSYQKSYFRKSFKKEASMTKDWNLNST
jgi:hypothetical protein